MTQRVFDVNNEQDMKDLFHPLNEIVQKIIYVEGEVRFLDKDGNFISGTDLIEIKCSQGTIINRPIQEATESDVGKICVFWDDNPDNVDNIGILTCISDCYSTLNGKVEFEKHRYQCDGISWKHCRRLTKQEIEELC